MLQENRSTRSPTELEILSMLFKGENLRKSVLGFDKQNKFLLRVVIECLPTQKLI
jgi:hypothetical protein